MNVSELIQIPDFNRLNISVFVGKPVLSFIFVAYLIGYLILSSILFYHWTAYGMKSPGIIFGETLFLVFSVALFLVAGLTLSYY